MNELNCIIALHIYILNVIHKVYIPGMRDFQGFIWVVTAKVAHLIGFAKYQSHIVVGCLLFYYVIILPKEVILC